MVAPRIDYQCCYEAAKIGPASGNELVSFPYPKCGAVCCDSVERARKLQAQHDCIVCERQWSKYPLVQGNPLAVLGCQLRDSTLFQSFHLIAQHLEWLITTQVVIRVLVHVLVLVENMTKPFFIRLLLNAPFWHVSIRPRGIHQMLK